MGIFAGWELTATVLSLYVLKIITMIWIKSKLVRYVLVHARDVR